MVEIIGLTGLRPSKEKVGEVTAPPYDVIKPGTELEKFLQQRENSLFHITLGSHPVGALEELIERGALIEDNEPCFYVYEQRYGNETRTGVFVAAAVSDYSKGEIIRHEKTFDEKVQGRLKLRRTTGYSFGPVFLLTKSPISSVLEEIKSKYEPEYEFTSDFGGQSELNGIKNRVFRVKENSAEGKKLKELIGKNNLYIADGHHRYHTSLKNNQTHFLAYIVEEAKIQAYNRVVTGVKKFDEVSDRFELEETNEFKTPEKHQFCIYSGGKSYLLNAKEVPDDVVGKFDSSILEREVYPVFELTHDMIMDHAHFDYYAESELDTMKKVVDGGKYDAAIALHPVSIEELMEVANAGLEDSNIVMPEKSTFFAPKILSGLFVYKHVII
ncbi:MAG: DUF1015 domain-containing protein [archaeon]